MKKYEIVLVINQDVPHQGVLVIAKKIENLLESFGKIVSSEYWGLRELAYPINNNKKARYFMLAVEMQPETVKTVSNYIHINESIIRSGIYSTENFEEESPMLSYSKNLVENTPDPQFASIFPNSVSHKKTK